MATETWVLNETRNVPITDPAKEITISGTMYSIVPNSPGDIQETSFTKVSFNYGLLNSSKYGLVYFYNPDYSGFYMSNDYASTGGTTSFTNNNDNDFWYSRNYTEMTNEQKLKFRTVTFDTAPSGDLLTWLQANAVKQVTLRVSVDLATAFPDKWAGLTIGKHTLQIRAKNPGNYLDSDLSTAIDFYKTVPITVTATNCTAASNNPTEFPNVEGGDTILTFNKKTGYTLPETIVITGVAGQNIGYSWTVASDGQSAQLKILKALGNIEVTVTGVAETYNITVNATHASKASGPSTIAYGGSATLTFTYDDGYFAPTDVTVVGATKTWTAGTSTLNLTNCTGPVTVTIEGAVKTYSITPALTNCTWDTENATTIASNQFTPIQLIINKNTGWTLPTEIQVVGVDSEYWSWNQATGIVTISHPQSNITITASAVREVYNITTNLTHATKESGPSTIAYGGNATLVFSFPTGYEAPADVTVTGATKSWAAGSGTLTLTNATGPVTVTVVGVASTTTLDGGTYKWKDNASLTEWTQEINFTSNGASYSGMRYTGNGTAMTLQYRYGGSDWVTVYNYDEDASTGSWVNDAYKIVDLGTSAQTVTAIFKADFIANTTKLTQLATPQNVTADGTTVSWNEVENATSYEIFADGVSIGTVENETGFAVSLIYTDDSVSGTFAYSLDGGATYQDITTPDIRLLNVTQIRLKSHGLNSGASIKQGEYGLSDEFTGVTISPGYPSDKSAYELDNIILTADTGFFLYTYYD